MRRQVSGSSLSLSLSLTLLEEIQVNLRCLLCIVIAVSLFRISSPPPREGDS